METYYEHGGGNRTKVSLYLSKEDIVALKKARHRLGGNNMFVNKLIRTLVWQIEEHGVIKDE
jgi:hypothetical protein